MTFEADLAPALDRVDELFADFHAAGPAPALVYGVVAGGRLVHTAGFGSSAPDERPDERPDEHTVFRIASMTKSFTAAALLLLRDRGRLRLDAPARDYVPELAGWRGPTSDSPVITVRDLATMSAGLPTDDPWGDRMESGSDEWLGELLAAGPTFASAPATGFEYSNLGFAILGRVIANASGRPYREFVTDELLTPLGLRDTGYDHAAVDPARRVVGHRKAPDGSWEPLPFSDPGAFSPMGGLFSTIADLARWVAGMLDAYPARDGADDHPLARAARREMQELQRLDSVDADLALADLDGRGRRAVRAAARGYGLGLFVERQTGRGSVVYHSGGYPGFGTHMRWHPVAGVGVIALANGTYAGPSRACAPALDLLLEQLRAPARRVVVLPALERARAQVEILVDDFDDDRADAVLASNVDLDEPRERRRAALATAQERAGAISGSGRLGSSSPATLEWRRTGADADQLLTIKLTPEPRPRVQTLDVRVVAHPSPELRRAADAVVAALNAGTSGWPAIGTAPGFASAGYERTAAVAVAVGGPFALDPDPSRAADPEQARFVVTAPGATWRLDLALEAGLVVRAGLDLEPEMSERPVEVRTGQGSSEA